MQPDGGVLHVPAGGHRGRAGAMPRCARCEMHLRLCLCRELQPLSTATRVVVLRSQLETFQSTNTGRLVPLALASGTVRPQGVGRGQGDLVEPGRRTLLLFPGPQARELDTDMVTDSPVTLVIPDGTWRTTRRMVTRDRVLRALEQVRLPAGPTSRYRLRSHPDRSCLATFEAVARALGILEGAGVQEALETLFERFVERTLFSRGRLGGRLPEGIVRSG